MTQITDGFRSLLSIPAVYDIFQSLMGGNAARTEISERYFRATSGHIIVDVGCGTAEILNYLPTDVDYYGFDLEHRYIDAARSQFPRHGHFYCRDITSLGQQDIPPCDLAISFGVLHHLEDNNARVLIENLYGRLRNGGRLVTVDPAYEPDQSFFARQIIKRDRGQNVRSGSEYLELVAPLFAEKRLTIRHDLLRIPYTHAIMECTK